MIIYIVFIVNESGFILENNNKYYFLEHSNTVIPLI
jgi:hypothetical protein